MRRQSRKKGPERLHFQHHSTYVKFGANLQLSRCEDQCCACSKVHCPFCNIHNYKPTRPANVRDHLNQTHFKHAILHKGKKVVIVKCYQQCEVSPGHFHCPYCPKQLLKKAGFLYHLRIHLKNAGQSLSLVEAPNYRQPEKILFDGEVIQLCSTQCQGSLGKHYHCPLCGKKSFEDIGPLSDHLWRCRELNKLSDQPQEKPLSRSKNIEELWAENITFNVGAPKSTDRYGDKCHLSVVRNVSDLPLTRCEEPGCCRHRFHCALCPQSKFKPAYLSHMHDHYLSHWNSRAVCGVYSSLVCYLPCLPRLGMAVYHFHCPKCGVARRRKSQFLAHVDECMAADMKSDKELYGNGNTEIASTTFCEPEMNVGIAFECGKDTIRGDNSSIIKIEEVTIEEIGLQTLAEDDGIAESVAEVEQAPLDMKKVWEVYDTVSAVLSPDFLSALEVSCPLEEFLNTIARETDVELITAPGINGCPVYSISGMWDNISRAKRMLRMKLPESIVSSMQEETRNVEPKLGDIQEEQSPEISQNSSQDSAQLEHPTSPQVSTPSSVPSVPCGIGDITVPLEDSSVMSTSNRRSSVSNNTDVSATCIGSSSLPKTRKDQDQDQSLEIMTRSMNTASSALDMLSSAIEIIKKEEENLNVIDIHPNKEISLLEDEVKTIYCPPRRGRPRKHQVMVSQSKEETSPGKSIYCPPKRGRPRKRQIVETPDMEKVSPVKSVENFVYNPPKRGRPRKRYVVESPDKGISPQTKRKSTIPENTNHDKEMESSDKIPNETSTPVKKYCTRGTQLDFSLLATGKKKKKEPQPKSIVKLELKSISETKSKPEHEPEPGTEPEQVQEQDESEPDRAPLLDLEGEEAASVASPESCTEMSDEEDSDYIRDLEDKDMEVEERDDVDDGPRTQKLNFGSMAVIPIVTFDMQSISITKQLSKLMKDSVDLQTSKIHSCSLCEFECSSFSDLIQHYSTEHEINEDLHCKECLVICLTDSLKNNHIVQCHEEQVDMAVENGWHKCPECPYDSDQFSAVTDHMLSVHKSECLRCDVCEKSFRQHKSLDIHLSLKHGPRQLAPRIEKTLTKCTICTFVGQDFSSLSAHLISEHQVVNLTRCDVCERVFDHETELEVHLKRQHGPSEEHLSLNRCSICGMLFNSRKNLAQHQVYIHKKPKKPKRGKDDISLECKTCYYRATSPADIRQHRLTHRTDVLKCPECDKTFATKPNLQFHMQQHHVGANGASCKICGKAFKHRRYLYGHMLRHTGHKKYSCEDCGKMFFEKTSMKEHQEIHKNSSERNYRYVCSYCGKRYNSKSNFSDHMNKHTGEKPYKCEHCEKSFGFRSQLAQHKIFVHSTDRPFKCKECNKSFKLSSKLQQHMVIHSGVGKHTCDICHRALSSAASLRGHLKKCQMGILKKSRVFPSDMYTVTAADSIVEMAVESFVIVNSQDAANDLQQVGEGQEVASPQTEVYACSVCKEEFEYYQNAVDHINTAHEDGGTDGQTDTVVLTEEGLPQGAVIKIEEDTQHGVNMTVGTYEY